MMIVLSLESKVGPFLPKAQNFVRVTILYRNVVTILYRNVSYSNFKSINKFTNSHIHKFTDSHTKKHRGPFPAESEHSLMT